MFNQHRRSRQKDQVVPQCRYTAVFEPLEEVGYIVTVPALPGLIAEGATFEEARAIVEHAIRGYLEALAQSGEGIPLERGEPITQRVTVTL